MSYLEDPRVFLATERTLLAWVRTEISIVAVAFMLKKFTDAETPAHQVELNVILAAMCVVTVLLSIMALVQACLSLSRLGAIEVPGPLAKPLVMSGGVVSVLLCIGATYILIYY